MNAAECEQRLMAESRVGSARSLCAHGATQVVTA
jgi:hypothetical protein